MKSNKSGFAKAAFGKRVLPTLIHTMSDFLATFIYYLFFAITSRGFFKFSDSFICATSLLLAVAVRANTGTEGMLAHNMFSLE